MGAPLMMARAELRHRWRSVIVLALLVGLTGGVVLGAVAGARRTSSALDRFREDANAHDVFLITTGTDPALVEEVLDLPHVATSVQVSSFLGTVDEPFDLALFASPDEALGMAIERPRIIEGRFFDQSDPSEVLATEESGLSVGERFTVRTLSLEEFAAIEEEFPAFSGPALGLEVVGISRLPLDLLGENDQGDAIATPAFHRRYQGEAASIDDYHFVDLAGGSEDFGAFQDAANGILPAGGAWSINSADVEFRPGDRTIEVLMWALLAFAAAAGLAGAVQVGQGLSRASGISLTEQATTAALGMTRRQRVAASLAAGGVAAVAGAILALVVAVAASPFMPVGVARRAEPDPGVNIDAAVLAVGALVLLVTTLAWTAFVAWRSTRGASTGAEQAPVSRPSFVASQLARAGFGATAVAGARMALEPGSGRTAVPVRSALVGAVAGVAGLVAALTFGGSLDRLVDGPDRWGFNWDFSPQIDPAEVEAAVAGQDVADLARVHVSTVQAGGDAIQAVAVESLKGSPSLSILSGRSPGAPDEVALGPATMDLLGVSLGERVELTGAESTLDLRVVGTALFPSIDSGGFDEGASVILSTLESLGLQEDAFSEVIVTLREGVDEAAAAERLAAGNPEALLFSEPTPPGDVTNLGQVDALPSLLAGFVALVAVAAVGHSLVVTVRRRRGDLALLRTLGFARRQVAATVSWQASLVVGIGLLLGIPLGLVAGRVLWAMVADRINVATDPAWPVLLVALLPVAAVLLANAIAWLPGRAAARIQPAVALRAE